LAKDYKYFIFWKNSSYNDTYTKNVCHSTGSKLGYLPKTNGNIGVKMSLKASLKSKNFLSSTVTLVLLSLLCSVSSFAAPALVDFGFDSIYQDNLSETPDSMGSSFSGVSTRAFASVRKGFILSEDLSFMMKVGVDYEAQHIDESADYVGVNVVLASTYRPFENVSAPYFKMSLDARNKNYQNDFGNEQLYRAKFSMNSQLTDTLSAQLGFVRRIGESEWAPIDTLNIQSWDTDRTEYFLSMDLNLDPATLYTKVALSEGDGIWTRQITNGGTDAYIGLFGNNVKHKSVDLGVNYPLTNGSALDLLARYSEVTRNGNDLHDITSLSIAFIKRLSL